MKSKLSGGVVVFFIAVLSATAAYADEPGTDGEEEALSEPGEPDKPADPVTAQLHSEVLRYYRGVGAEPSEAELKSALNAAFDMLFADVSIEQISLAIDAAIRRHESGVDVPFAVAIPRFVLALAEEAHVEQSEASEAVREPAWRPEAVPLLAEQAAKKAQRDQRVGTGLMASAFVAQGISLGTTFASIFASDIMWGSWVVQAATIPFAPMGVGGFALRYGGSNKTERLRWTGIGLLEAAAFSAVVGGVTLAALFSPHYYGSDGVSAGVFGVPGMVSHFGASIAFGIAGGVSLAVAKAQAPRQGLSQSRRSPARPSHRGFVLPTIAPRPGGLSLGLAGVF